MNLKVHTNTNYKFRTRIYLRIHIYINEEHVCLRKSFLHAQRHYLKQKNTSNHESLSDRVKVQELLI